MGARDVKPLDGRAAPVANLHSTDDAADGTVGCNLSTRNLPAAWHGTGTGEMRERGPGNTRGNWAGHRGRPRAAQLNLAAACFRQPACGNLAGPYYRIGAKPLQCACGSDFVSST